MFKASDFVKGKMNEMFMRASSCSLAIKHQQHGEFELVAAIKLNSMIQYLQTLTADHIYLSKTEFGYSWMDVFSTNEDTPLEDIASIEAAKEMRIYDKGLSNEQLKNLFGLIGYHFETKAQAIDEFITHLAGITDVESYSHKDIKESDIH